MTAKTIDHSKTRKALTDQVSAFLANPAGWPAAMAARAVRLRAGHPSYSPTNHALIVSQLIARFTQVGMCEETAFTAAVQAAGEEIAPRYIWAKRGYVPMGGALNIWSRPVPMLVDPVTGEKVAKETPGAREIRVFLVEQTFLSSDVVNPDGETAQVAYRAPELEAGEARDVFERLTVWIAAQGWRVTRSGGDMRADGYTDYATRRIVVHGGLVEWSAVGTLAHEIAHALLHGADEDRPYAGEHRGDMEAEAEAVAYGLLSAFGQGDLVRSSARYTAEWTRDPERVAVAYERSCHVLDAVAAVAYGAEGVEVAVSAKAQRAVSKADNKALAAALREAGLEPKGEAWRRAKAGEAVADIAADLLITA